MTKLIALSKDPAHVWFATSGLFDWAAEFLLARTTDAELRETLRRDALSGYLYLDSVPDGQRAELLRALREDLPAAVDRELYPRPLNLREQQPLMAARIKTLTAMAWDHDERETRHGAPLVLLLPPAARAEFTHGLQPWLRTFLADRHPSLAEATDPGEIDLRTLPEPERTALLRTLRDDLPMAAEPALADLDTAAARWSRTELRTLSLQATTALAP